VFDRAEKRDERWEVRRADVERCVRDIYEKEAKKPLLLDPGDPRPSARAFIEAHDGVLRCYAGDIYEWTGTRYKLLDEAYVRDALYAFLEKAQQMSRAKPPRRIPFAPNKPKVDHVLDALRSLIRVAPDVVPGSWLDGRREGAVLACRNGILRLSDRKLLPHTPEHFNTAAADSDHDPNAAEPVEWLKFMGSLFPADPKSIETIHEVLGYVISGEAHYHKMFMFLGPKRSGKGTIARMLTRLLGNAGHTGLVLASFNDTFGLEPLLGKILVLIPDARLKSRAHVVTERLLAISGQDDLQVARKYKSALPAVRLPARVLFLTNILPALADASGTVASRFIIVQFDISFYGREDHGLEARLVPELPGILNLAIDGWQRLTARGRFAQPKSGEDAAKNLSYLASPITQYIEEEYELGGTDETRVDDVYLDYADWWQRTGQPGHPGNLTAFGMALAAAGFRFKRERRRPPGDDHYVYVGIRKKDTPKQGEFIMTEDGRLVRGVGV
jgi:putative DNA primase/helicase